MHVLRCKWLRPCLDCCSCCEIGWHLVQLPPKLELNTSPAIKNTKIQAGPKPQSLSNPCQGLGVRAARQGQVYYTPIPGLRTFTTTTHDNPFLLTGSSPRMALLPDAHTCLQPIKWCLVNQDPRMASRWQVSVIHALHASTTQFKLALLD